MLCTSPILLTQNCLPSSPFVFVSTRTGVAPPSIAGTTSSSSVFHYYPRARERRNARKEEKCEGNISDRKDIGERERKREADNPAPYLSPSSSLPFSS